MEDEECVLIGPHELRFRPPDRMYLTMRDVIEASHIEKQNMYLRAYAKRYGKPLRAICDVEHVVEFSTGARKSVVQMDQEYPYVGCAVVGANFTFRTIAIMLIRAGQVLAPHHFNFPIYFAKTVAEAEAWLNGLPEPSKSK